MAVICIHVGAPTESPLWANYAFQQLSRFAVPFFFIASGYFLTDRLRSVPKTVSYILWRVLPATIFWVLVYFWAPIRDGVADPLSLLTEGGGLHLWYFPSLIVALLLASVLFQLGGARTLSVCAASLFLIAILFGRYMDILGLTRLDWNVRNGLFFGLPFVTIGVLLALWNWRPSVGLAFAIFLLGAAAQVLEVMFVANWYQVRFINPDFVFSTLLFGTGAFLFFRSLRAGPILGQLSSPGRVALGAYAVHVQVLHLLMGQHHTLMGSVLVVGGTAVVSIAVSQLCSSVPILRFAFR